MTIVASRAKDLLILAAVSVTLLAGCSGSPQEVTADYEGYGANQVAACVDIATYGGLREDRRVPSSIRVEDVAADFSGNGPGDISISIITGRTVVGFDEGADYYTWRCRVTMSAIERSLTAELPEFNLVK